MAILLVSSTASGQQNFSCGYGMRGACLSYGDKVVDQNSVCFSNLTCGYKGLVCKAKLDDVVEEYDTLVQKYNELLRKQRELASTAQEILEKQRTSETEYDDLERKFKRLTSEHEQQSDEMSMLRIQNSQLVETLRSASSRPERLPKKVK